MGAVLPRISCGLVKFGRVRRRSQQQAHALAALQLASHTTLQASFLHIGYRFF